MPLLRQGPLKHGLISLWHEMPVLYSLHSHTYTCIWFSMQMPWFEQLAKHDVKSPLYPLKISFNWVPVLFGVNKDVEETTVVAKALASRVVVEIKALLVDDEDVEDVESSDVEEWLIEITVDELVIKALLADVGMNVVDVETSLKNFFF